MILALKFFLIILISTLIPQIIKIVRAKVKSDVSFFEALAETGGMPSSHASLMASVTMLIFLESRFSAIFFLSFTLMMIVIRDAVGVRFAVGEQAKTLNTIIYQLQSNKPKSAKIMKVKVVKGHKNEEVAVGTTIGIIVALLIFFLL
jgi:acid phosphatase family membrane protein YuiD